MALGYVQGRSVMMMLGEFQFSIETAAYQEFIRATEYKWASQDRFQAPPALQFVGFGEDSITLPGVIYPEYRGGLVQVDAMRKMASAGWPLVLIDGLGFVLGQWVITRVEEKGSVFAAAGVARKQEFSIGLRFFEAVIPPASSGVASAAAPADQVAAESGAGAAGSLAASMSAAATKLASGLNDAMASVQGYAAELGAAVDSVATPLRRGYEIAVGLKNTASDVKRLAAGTKSQLAQVDSLQKLLSASTSAVTNGNQAGAALKKSLGDLSSLGTVAAPVLKTVQGAMIQVNRLTVAATSFQGSATAALKALA